jgi:hypothetical protein
MRRTARAISAVRMTYAKVSLNFCFGANGIPVTEEVGSNVREETFGKEIEIVGSGIPLLIAVEVLTAVVEDTDGIIVAWTKSVG